MKTDCFAALVISAETYSGMFFIHTEAAAQASSSRTELWSCSLLKGLGGSGPKQREQTAFTTSPPHSFSFSNSGDVCSQVFPYHSKKEKAKQGLGMYYCYVLESLGQVTRILKKIILEM